MARRKSLDDSTELRVQIGGYRFDRLRFISHVMQQPGYEVISVLIDEYYSFLIKSGTVSQTQLESFWHEVAIR